MSTSIGRVAVGASIALVGLFAACDSSSTGGGTDPGQPDPSHKNVILKDRLGQPITAGSQEPYSPRETCGGCHDVDAIANGYHFQQGRTSMTGTVITKKDYFNDGRTFLQSSGMYGKW